jgi:hypothetical protein
MGEHVTVVSGALGVAEELRRLAAVGFDEIGGGRQSRPDRKIRVVLVHDPVGARVRASHPPDADEPDSDGALSHLLSRW